MLNKLANEIHENAVAHGWWDDDRSFPVIVALCHSELSEALEEYRDGNENLWYGCHSKQHDIRCVETGCEHWQEGKGCRVGRRDDKPEGIAVEMIDCIIRILDWCAKEGVDVGETLRIKLNYNKSRPYRHGGKKA